MAARGRPRQFDEDAALDAALMLFWRHGFEGTSMSALSEAMGVNMPSLYATFGNKEALFGRSLERYMRQHAVYLPTAMKEATSRAVVAKLFQGAIDLAMHPDNPDGCMLVQGALATGPAAETIRVELNGRRALAERCIRARFELAMAAGDLPARSDPASLARYVMTLIWGLSVQAAGGATRAELDEVAERVLETWPGAEGKAMATETARQTGRETPRVKSPRATRAHAR